MQLSNFQFTKEAQRTDVSIAVGIFENHELTSAAQFLDETTHSLLTNALKTNRFKGKVGQTLVLIAPNDLKVNRLILFGLGEKSKVTKLSLEEAGASLYGAVANTPDQELTIHTADLDFPTISVGETAALIANGLLLKSYRFDKYKTVEKADEKPALQQVSIVTEQPEQASRAFEPLRIVSESALFCRELQNEPANVIYPLSYAAIIEEKLRPVGVDVQVLKVAELEKLGMGSLLAVGQGSDHEPCVVIMCYNNGPSDMQPVSFVGKGVTFDSGGISIKPGSGMEEMRYDMSGSAAVVGVMHALASRKAKVNAVGIVGLVENMPSGRAMRPGDILKTMSGQTIQVENTDAEGRLVLCDIMWHVQQKYKPQIMIDLATLTGAIVIGLGSVYAGLFSNDDTLAQQLSDCGEKSGDLLWRLPLHPRYNKQLNLDFCDMNNMGGREAGSITAAEFLQRYVKDTKWAHLDIAGTAWNLKQGGALFQKGASSIGVRLLNQLVQDYYEK